MNVPGHKLTRQRGTAMIHVANLLKHHFPNHEPDVVFLLLALSAAALGAGIALIFML